MNPSTALARVVVDELVRGGVREAVLAPGSRSAPLALALHEAEAGSGTGARLRLHVRIDERSAGFLALGLAKASGAPVPVVTTSGTAAANLHPAVLEASHTGVPLLVLTADRPPESRATGANQTIDQLALFGSVVRAFHEVGAPERAAGQVAYWRALVCRTLAAARGSLTADPGPAHLNMAFREPLVPDVGDDPWPEPLDGRTAGRPWTEVAGPRIVGLRNEGVDAGDWPARTLVIVGDVSPEVGQAAVGLAEARGWPVVAEPTGNARGGPNVMAGGAELLAVEPFLAEHPPERVLVVGRPTLSRHVVSLLRDPSVGVDVVAPTGQWADATRSAARVLTSLPVARDHHPDTDHEWLAAWRRASVAASSAIELFLDELESESSGLHGLQVARALVSGLPAGALLFAGSSMPARDLFLAAEPAERVTVLANRGVAGIDGAVSTAVGAALAWQAAGGGAAFALLGDLTFLHDANGLLMPSSEPHPQLTVVVVNNDGGAIFALLEQGGPAHAPAFERVFGTPHGVDLAALCAATATAHVRVSTAKELLDAALDPRAGFQVVEVRTSRAEDRQTYVGLQARISAAVQGQP